MEAQLMGLLALSAHAVIGVDARQQITLVNHAAEMLFGYTSQELVGQPLALLIPHLGASDTIAESPAVAHQVTTCLHKGGTSFVATTDIAWVARADGAVCMIQIHVPESLGALLLSDTLLDVIQDAVIITDPAIRITGWNAAAEKLYGWSAAEALGRPAHDLLQTTYLDGDRAQLLQQLQERGVWRGEVIHHHRDGHPIPILATTTWMRGPAGESLGVLSVNRDISALKATEFRLRVAATRLDVLASASQLFAEAEVDLAAVLDRIVKTTAEVLADGCAVSLITDDGLWLQRVAVYDIDSERLRWLRASNEQPQRLDAPSAGPRIIRTGEPVFLPVVDHEQFRAVVRTESQALWDQLAFHSMLGVPMRVHGQVIGIVTLFRHRPEQLSFTEDDLRLAQDLADRAALAIANARLFQQVQDELAERKQAEQALQRATERLSILAAASHAFAEAGSEYPALLEKIARISADRLRAACSIRLLSDDGQWLDVAAIGHYGPVKQQEMRASLTPWRIHLDDRVPAAIAVRTGEPQFIPVIDHAALRATASPEQQDLLQRFFPHSVMVIPLRLHGRSIGSLSLARDEPETPAFTADDLRLAQDLVDRAAQVIGNAQLLVRVQDERALLARRVAERTADLSLANAELARAARLKDEFLANMSHELRTPLNSILGRSEALQEAIYGPVTPEQTAALQSIVEGGQHLLSLINDILDLSKIESGRLTLDHATVDVDLLSTVALRMVAQTAVVKRISLSSTFDGQVQLLLADERRLKQILVNLLSNAVKFTPEGGQVGLEVRGNPEQQTATFTVWDTGVGIAAEDLPKLFQPFVQLDSRLNRQYTGTGLGLSLVARLAQAHGGSVAIESTPGQGSRFSVTLPWTPTMPTLIQRPVPTTVDTVRPAVRQALVVEDSPTAAAQITRYLRDLGARVEIHPHGTGTVERAITLQPDVIVLDLLLPDDDGWDILQQLKAEPRTQHIPVLVVSVVDEPARAYDLGAAAVLVKPIDRPIFEQALRQILTPRPEAPPLETALVVAPHLARPLVLLADDNEEALDSMGDYLRAKGYDLRVARNGNEALVQAQETQPDVILMDIQMPGLDGLEAIRRIRAESRLAHTPIIAVTALAMPGDHERCLAAGANEYLAKPVNLRSLVTLIEEQRKRQTDE